MKTIIVRKIYSTWGTVISTNKIHGSIKSLAKKHDGVLSSDGKSFTIFREGQKVTYKQIFKTKN